METWTSTYVHEGVSYTREHYTGSVMPTSVYKELVAAEMVAFEARKAALFAEPEYQAKLAKEQEVKAKAKARAKSKAEAEAKIREELVKEIAKLRSALIARGTPVTFEEVEEWRISRGYLWKVVSPKGNVYTEVLKQVTIKEPAEYVEYHALKSAAQHFAGIVA